MLDNIPHISWLLVIQTVLCLIILHYVFVACRLHHILTYASRKNGRLYSGASGNQPRLQDKHISKINKQSQE